MSDLTEAQRRDIDHAMLESLSSWFEMRAKGYRGPHSFNDWDVSFMLVRVAIQHAPTHAVIDAGAHYLRVAELLEANNRYLERARASEAESTQAAISLEHLRRQARAHGDLLTCVACEKEIFAGDRYFPDVNGGQCVDCAPTYQALIEDNEGFVDLENEEPRTPEDCRSEYDAHIAAGGQPTDSMAKELME